MGKTRETLNRWEGLVYKSRYSCCSDVFLAEPIWHTPHFLSFAPSYWSLNEFICSSQTSQTDSTSIKNVLFKSMKNICIWGCTGCWHIQKLYWLRFWFELKLYFYPCLRFLFLFLSCFYCLSICFLFVSSWTRTIKPEVALIKNSVIYWTLANFKCCLAL